MPPDVSRPAGVAALSVLMGVAAGGGALPVADPVVLVVLVVPELVVESA